LVNKERLTRLAMVLGKSTREVLHRDVLSTSIKVLSTHISLLPTSLSLSSLACFSSNSQLAKHKKVCTAPTTPMYVRHVIIGPVFSHCNRRRVMNGHYQSLSKCHAFCCALKPKPKGKKKYKRKTKEASSKPAKQYRGKQTQAVLLKGEQVCSVSMHVERKQTKG
jgi:hypothetical protein